MGKRVRGRKVWLVTWDWTGGHAAVPEHDVIAAILRPQTSPDTVKKIVELLYAAREYDPVGKLSAMTDNPYPAEFGTVEVKQRTASGEVSRQRVRYTGQIHCGHNPFLYARLVNNLRPKDPANPDEGLTWDEHSYPSSLK